MNPRRQYLFALLAGAVGSGLIWLALREQWAQAVFIQPKPLPQQTVGVSGADLAPLTGGLALAALACLLAVIATRGAWRKAVGAALALLGAGAGAAVMTSVTAASVLSVAASKVGSPQSAIGSGAAGSTTSGSGSGGSAVVIAGSAGHAIIGGAEWRALVLVGALLIFVAGLATVSRGADWPVMSSKYELPRKRPAGAPASGADTPPAEKAGEADEAAVPAGPRDSASMWESLSGGEDPTG